jgi:dipeptidyl aminopeptidase/acylaminoacyl peptidase
VSHAGISSIASYWGEGYWGYSYSGVASAESFPWNRQDIYVDQSPLFRADRLRVPLLLTHGEADHNVPVGQSDAFFVAAKLLGKTVEFVRIAGQDHWILDHAQRQRWSETILAWFDRWLKDEPEWWDALYGSAAGSSDLHHRGGHEATIPGHRGVGAGR